MNENSDASATAGELVPWALGEFEKPLMGYAYGLLKDAEHARDVVQDAFIKLCRQDPEPDRQLVKAWLFTVCRNRALDLIKKDGKMIAIDTVSLDANASEQPTPAQDAVRRDAHGEAMALLSKLPENQREAIRLRFQSDLSYREIAEVMEISVSNVGFLLHTGLRRMRDQLQALDEHNHH